METLAVIVLTVAATVGLLLIIGHLAGRKEEKAQAAALESAKGPAPELPPHLHELYVLNRNGSGFYDVTARPEDLLAFRPFQLAVEVIAGEPFALEDRFDLVFGTSGFLSCAAIEALARADEPGDLELRKRLLESLNDAHTWLRWFILRALAMRDDRAREEGEIRDRESSLFAAVFAVLDDSWSGVVAAQVLQSFVRSRLLAPPAEALRAELEAAWPPKGEGVAARIRSTVASIDPELAGRLAVPDEDEDEAVASPLPRPGPPTAPERPTGLAAEVGHFIPTTGKADWIEHDELTRIIDELEGALEGDKPSSLLLVGESGVGKTTAVHALARRLARDQWKVLEAPPTSIVAGQKYVGQLEARVRDLVELLDVGKRRILFLPRFHESIWAGRASEIPRALLHLLMPHVDRGSIVIIGETTPEGHQRLLQTYPHLRTLLYTRVLPSLPADAARDLAVRWGERHSLASGRDLFGDVSLSEVQSLAKQYLAEQASPGSLLSLLEGACHHARQRKGDVLSRDDVLDTLAEQTGLPRNLLDDNATLDLEKARAFLSSRVMGQKDAIDCLVERLAMIKAGLTDPTRPLGVFLFAGPTGTGKTEMGKTLAEYLFGSPDRMIRLDMSELQTADDIARVTGERSVAGTVSLVQRIRSQPFSVILLDEFEKAHPRVWDLFLQMFDDGRLTGRGGDTADFRHSVVIMTSNAGFEDVDASIGFSSRGPFATDGHHRVASMDKRLRKTFRPELLNRMDRVVVFGSLDRATMRSLIRKELNDALQRRGLRSRSWAVEWDSAAVDFLLEQGFTTNLGARPLKRAIERHVLAPLARTIVNREAPAGDQFLFIGSDGDRVTVTFVDPDAPETEERERGHARRRALTLENIMLDGLGGTDEVEFLHEVYESTVDRIEGADWAERKEAAFTRMADTSFWSLPDRFVTLGEAEYLDRIEAALGTAGSLLERLRGSRERERARYPRSLLQGLAQQLYLLNLACRDVETGAPRDAFVLIETEETPEHARSVAAMYERWARKRRMRSEVLVRQSEDRAFRFVLAVSGFGAYSLLAPESGVHLFETPVSDQRDAFLRERVRVEVAPQGETPTHGGDDRRREAEQAFAARTETANVVRVYRSGPSPLVRDRVRHWRTGRIERVLDGDFDLLADRS